MKSLTDMMKACNESQKSSAAPDGSFGNANDAPISDLFSQINGTDTPEDSISMDPSSPQPVVYKTAQRPAQQHRAKPGLQPKHPDAQRKPSQMEQMLSQMNSGDTGMAQGTDNPGLGSFGGGPGSAVRPRRRRGGGLPSGWLSEAFFIILTIALVALVIANWNTVSMSIARFLIAGMGSMLILLVLLATALIVYFIFFRRRR